MDPSDACLLAAVLHDGVGLVRFGQVCRGLVTYIARGLCDPFEVIVFEICVVHAVPSRFTAFHIDCTSSVLWLHADTYTKKLRTLAKPQGGPSLLIVL